MPTIVETLIEDWGDGVITSLKADEVPKTASPHAYNTALTAVAGSRAVPQKRKGLRTCDRTAITGTPAILGMYEFRRFSAGNFTPYHLIICSNGRFEYMDTAFSRTTVSSSAFTSGTYYPDFADANNLCFIANGQDANKKFDGTNFQAMGITRPTVGTMAAADGGAGSHNGTYELRVTYGNSSTGEESSASNTAASTVTVSSRSLDWADIPISSDPQVDRRYLYVRNTSTMQVFKRAGTISNNTSTGANTSVADSALTVLAPDTAENDPPPTTNFLAWHKSRMFTAGDADQPNYLYYSKVGLPESFDESERFERVNPDDGQEITALHPVHDVLLIFKTHSMYALVGDDPSEWEVQCIDPRIGCLSHRSVCTANGWTYFWSDLGPMRWRPGSPPEAIGQALISSTLEQLNKSQFNVVDAKVDYIRQRVLFAVAQAGATRNGWILPFNFRLERWEGIWDPMDASTLGVVEDTSDTPWVFLGGYSGQIFRIWDTSNDGIAGGTKTGTFVASGTSVSTITDLTATFDTTGGGLVERKVTILDANGRKVGTVRPRITANTATALTLSVAMNGLTNAATYTYIVGGPDFEFDVYWNDQGRPFDRKKYEFLYLQADATPNTLQVDLTYNFDTSTRVTKTTSFGSSVGATWGNMTWGSSLWGGGAEVAVNKRLRIGHSGWAIRARLRNHYHDQDFTLRKAAVRAMVRSDHLT